MLPRVTRQTRLRQDATGPRLTNSRTTPVSGCSWETNSELGVLDVEACYVGSLLIVSFIIRHTEGRLLYVGQDKHRLSSVPTGCNVPPIVRPKAQLLTFDWWLAHSRYMIIRDQDRRGARHSRQVIQHGCESPPAYWPAALPSMGHHHAVCSIRICRVWSIWSRSDRSPGRPAAGKINHPGAKPTKFRTCPGD